MVNFYKNKNKCVIESKINNTIIVLDNISKKVITQRGKLIFDAGNHWKLTENIKIKLSDNNSVSHDSDFIVLSDNIIFFHEADNDFIYYFFCDPISIVHNIKIESILDSLNSIELSEGYVEFKKKDLNSIYSIN